jgi:hypothetical protein
MGPPVSLSTSATDYYYCDGCSCPWIDCSLIDPTTMWRGRWTIGGAAEGPLFASCCGFESRS